MLTIKVYDEDEKLAGVFGAEAGDFKTGSRGYKATTKIKIGDKKYQTQINLVEIGSKPQGEGAAETETDDAAE